MSSQLNIRALSVFLFAILINACTYAPENASTFQGNSSAISVTVSGAYTKPNIPIQVQGYNMSTATWVNLGNAVSSSTPTIDNAKGKLYTWTVSVVPGGTLWPNNGLVQLRAKATDGGSTYYPVTFDDFSCVVDELNDGKNYVEAGAACASYNTPNLTLVDVDGVPNKNQVDYLNVRTTPISSSYSYNCTNNLNCEQAQYYANIGAPATFNGWLAQSAFGGFLRPANAASAKYYNAFDLGLGRDMNCRQTFSGKVSCYVTNYGTPVVDDHVAALADLISSTDPVATVAMEYLPSASSNQVTFYVYDGAGNLLKDIPLDQQGAKAVPGVCLNCHGGSYNPSSNEVTNAQFLPFDIENYQFSSDPAYSLSSQQEAFRKLNQMVLATNPPVDFADLVNNWYDNQINTSGQTFNTEFVPAGWSENPTVYNELVKPYCRMCHIALESYRDWDSLDELKNYGSYAIDLVCNSSTARMPQAQLTTEKFFKSGARAHLIGFMQKHAGITPTETCTPN